MVLSAPSCKYKCPKYLQQNMFKKRNTTKTNTNIDTILTQINSHQLVQDPQHSRIAGSNPSTDLQLSDAPAHPHAQPSENCGDVPPAKKNGVCEIGGFRRENWGTTLRNVDRNIYEPVIENQEQAKSVTSGEYVINQKNPEQMGEIDQCFAELIILQKQQEINHCHEQKNQNSDPLSRLLDDEEVIQPGYLSGQGKTLEPIEFFPGQIVDQAEQEQVMNPPTLPMIHQVIMEDQSGQCIEVREDFGEFGSGSDESSNSDYFKESLENKIIKQALTKHNYDKLRSGMDPGYESDDKNKLKKKLQKISMGRVQRKMQTDLKLKTDRSAEMMEQVKNFESRLKLKRRQIEQQVQNKNKIEEELNQVKNMIELLYYFGSELELPTISDKKIADLALNSKWSQKLEAVRNKVARNRKQFEDRLKHGKFGSDGSEKEDSEVQQICRNKFKDQWDVEDEDAELAENQAKYREKWQRNDSDEIGSQENEGNMLDDD